MSLGTLILLWSCGCLFLSGEVRSGPCGSNNGERTTMYVLAMVPIPNKENPPANDRGYSFVPAVQLALDHINEAGFLSRYNVTLNMSIADSGCDITTRTSVSFVENVFYSQKSVIGVVGPFCSEASIRLAELAQFSDHTEIVHLMLGNTPILDDHKKYQYTFGMITSSVAHVNTIIDMIQHNNWERVAVLYDSTRKYFTSTFQRLQKELKVRQLDHVLNFTGAVDESFYIPLNQVDSLNIRIVFVLLSPGPARKLACIAGNTNFVYPIHQFIFTDRSADNFIETNKTDFEFSTFENGEDRNYKCDLQTIAKGVNGSLMLRYALDSVEETVVTESGYTVGEINSEYEMRVAHYSQEINTTVEPYIYAGRYYDGAWALALGLNRTLSQFDHAPCTDNFTFREMLKQSLYDTRFQGFSVNVAFDSETGHVTDNVDIFQVNDSTEMSQVGVWNGNQTIYCSGPRPPTSGRDCSSENPVDGVFIKDRFEDDPVTLSSALAGLGLVGVSLVFVVTVCFHIAVVVLRNYRIVKASSPRLSHFIFLGCYLKIFALLLNTIHLIAPFSDNVEGMAVCNLTIIASFIGYALIFSTLTARSWRLYRIFSHSFNSQKYNSDVLLALIIAILVSINVLLYIPVAVWGRVQEVVDIEIIEDDRVPVRRVETMCSPLNSAFLFIPVLYLVLLTLSAVVLAILNRKVKLKDFNDSKRTNTLAFLLAILWGLFGSVLLILMVVNNDINIVYILYSLLLVISVCLTQCLLFLPLIIGVAIQKKAGLEDGLGKLTTGFRKMSLVF